ncbi:MAG: response regulator [Defluviitaleaceae bacterium]|nr:response regulator [Defluviitaleaceae bacterium]
MRFLVVDDIALMRESIKDILANHCKANRSSIFQAADGHGAIEKYTKLKPDLVFLDINMPGADGIAITKSILKIDPNARIVMCTGSSDREDIRKSIEAGAVGYIVKPPLPSAVKKVVEEALTANFDSSDKDKIEYLNDQIDIKIGELDMLKNQLEEELAKNNENPQESKEISVLDV